MRIGSVVKNVHTDEVCIITKLDNGDYVVINNEFLVPKEHLEVICK